MIKTNAQPDPPLQFPDGPDVLAASELDAAQQDATAITVRWYLSFCRRSRVAVCKQSARDFVVQVEREKRPAPGQLECWKEAIRWFFCAAPRPRRPAPQAEPRAEVAGGGMDAGRGPVAVGAGEGWEERLRQVLRVRHYSYRTEQTYVEWAQRLGRFCHPRPLEQVGEAELKAFLDHLAVAGQVSASTQRQALNALVFLLREALGQSLGDFSDYTRARAGSAVPVGLTREEMRRLLEALDGQTRLMAQVMYGGGLRLMELIRLRVKDVDVERRQIAVRDGKGGKDRVTTLPEVVLPELRKHLATIQHLYQADRAAGVAPVFAGRVGAEISARGAGVAMQKPGIGVRSPLDG